MYINFTINIFVVSQYQVRCTLDILFGDLHNSCVDGRLCESLVPLGLRIEFSSCEEDIRRASASFKSSVSWICVFLVMYFYLLQRSTSYY